MFDWDLGMPGVVCGENMEEETVILPHHWGKHNAPGRGSQSHVTGEIHTAQSPLMGDTHANLEL